MWKKAALGLMIFYYSAFGFNFGVSPTGFDISLEKRSTQEVKILNNSNRPMKIEVVTERPENCIEDDYMGDWIAIYPKIISINPLEEKTVRFTVRKPEELKSGEYRSYMVFKELPKTITEEKDVNIQFLGEVAINVYGQLGDTNGEADVKKVALKRSGDRDNDLLAVEVKNVMNKSLVLEYEMNLYNENKKNIKKLEGKIARVAKNYTGTVEKEIKKITKEAKYVDVKILSEGKELYKEQKIKL